MTEENGQSGQTEQTQVETPAQGGEQTNESRTEQAQVASTEGKEQQQETQSAKPEGEPEGEEAPKKRESGSQRLKRERDLLRARIAELESGQPKGQPRQAEPEPKESDFQTYHDFEKAHRKWEISNTVGQVFERQETQARERAQNEARMATLLDHQERVEAFREKVPDFDEVISKMKGTNVREDVMFDVMESDKSDLIVYHLAKNPDKVRELNAMSERERAKEIGRLEGSLRMPAAKRATNAPAPLTQVTGGASQGFDPATASMEDYAKNWQERQKKLRAGV